MELKSLSSQQVVLASEAKWRSNILSQLNIKHECCNHQYEEPEFKEGDVVEFVKEIAVKKALSIKNLFPDHIIISADQLIEIDGIILGKPGNFDNAFSQLTNMNGKQHRLICALCVVYQNQVLKDFEVATIKMRQLKAVEIKNYLKIDKPYDCAGSYKIEMLGSALFENIQVKDLNTIVGIPGNLLISQLRLLGFSNLL